MARRVSAILRRVDLRSRLVLRKGKFHRTGLMSAEDDIRTAIRRHQVITFVYHGRWRKAEPHVLGFSNGVRQVLCFQLDGETSSGRLPHWRRFDVEAISEIRLVRELFAGPRADVHSHRSTFDIILEVVQ